MAAGDKKDSKAKAVPIAATATAAAGPDPASLPPAVPVQPPNYTTPVNVSSRVTNKIQLI